MAVARPRPYRRILTSALHRRFVHASALSLLVCYIISFVIGEKTSLFWSWFPIGICGFRTILLFVSSLVVFVLRVGQMHIGTRTTTSPITTFKHLFPLHIVQTFGWYMFSAWWFSEVYVWSAPTSANLGWVKPGRINERPSLNERPIYLHTYHMLLAIVQAVFHLYCDYDRITIPVAKGGSAADQRTHPVESVSKRIQRTLPRVIITGFTRSAIIAAASPFIYSIFLRRVTWRFTLYFAKLFWNFSRSSAEPPGLVPPLGLSLLARSVISGGLLLLCWQTSNLFFTSFIGKEPLKRGQPLTAEAKDPNGSLLNGLMAKKEVVSTFAFWELSFISQRFPDRRKAIFSDIDREGGAAWSQILTASTETIKGITTRIDQHNNPPSSQRPVAPAEKPQPVLQTLPRLTDPPKEGNFFAPSPKGTSRQERFGEALSSTAKAYGKSADWTPTARARARDAFERASSAVLSPERKQKLLGSSSEPKLLTGPPSARTPESLNPLLAQLLRSPLGHPVRQTYAQRLSNIVLGRPYASLCPIVDAIESLTRLLIASLAEDQYGKVQADVPHVVRLFTHTLLTLDAFVASGLDVHWSDVSFPPSSQPQAQALARRVPDVDLVLDALRSSLSELLVAFGPYARDIGLVEKDLRLAREAASLVDADDVFR
ncbi:hypothetical protein ASPZODRAFT_144681 [Penicilliopsis zonata CBS 506.65]|uniref:Nucleoporin NDC1 n=1 Tax=Penicilliopsis zonata CBS 506.65 TaxID=1073090 RepID=A0A1L9SC28_9EURO|nr:hypothetical protein ASPZODRAFT_144681 [Penicilliopsis zonata CBS 506.65]OJJ44726.1 hypothetical protein ASPZODRAFT_144681 [Penicilliopsis zonata CBS 506.65]